MGLNNIVIYLVILTTAATSVVWAAVATTNTDDKKPYEFGFTITGQHRHEKKDANGLISGDFGFITGDGTYHRAAYATDENGKFRLISSRSSYKRNKAKSAKSVAVPVSPPEAPPPPPPPPPPPVTVRASKAVTFDQPTAKPITLKSCSNCKVTQKESPPVQVLATVTPPSAPRIQQTLTPREEKLKTVTKMVDAMVEKITPPLIQSQIKTAKLNANPPTKAPKSYDIVSKQVKKQEFTNFANPAKATNLVLPTVNTPTVSNEIVPVQKQVISPPQKTLSKAPSPTTQATPRRNPTPAAPSPPTSAPKVQASRSPPVSNLKASRPISVAAPSARTLPLPIPATVISTPSLLKKMNEFLTDLLYKFNYSTTYNGHNEEGYRNGNKKGGYFTIGRDNVRRTVEYDANENGFIPHVKYELISPAMAPSALNDKNGILIGSEFKWIKQT